jgi:hypothetical protein
MYFVPKVCSTVKLCITTDAVPETVGTDPPLYFGAAELTILVDDVSVADDVAQ